MTESTGLENDVDLLEMMEIIQDDNEKLLEENGQLMEVNRHCRKELEECMETFDRQKSEAQEKISELFSQNSVLRSELRKKSETILSLNEQIGKLSESDIVLKQNEELKRQNNRLEQEMSEVREETEKRVEDAERRAADEVSEVEVKIERISEEKQKLDVLQRETDRFISARAKDMIAEEFKNLEEQYKIKELLLSAKFTAKVGSIYGFSVAVMIYGIAVTVMRALSSERIMADGGRCAMAIRNVAVIIFDVATGLAEYLRGVSGNISNHLLAVMLGWILVVLSYVVVIGGCVGLAGFVVYKIGKLYYRQFWDAISLVVVLTSLALIVWGADVIGEWVSWNVVLVFIGVQVGYVGVRQLNGGNN